MKRKVDQRDVRGEQRVIASVKRGDTEQFREIEKTYHDKILFYLRHLVGSKEEAEDILQEVFLKVFASIDRFDNRRKFSSWVYRIAHNEAMNHLKHRNKYRSVSWEDIVSVKDRMETSDREDTPQERWIRGERRVEVRRALQTLPQKYREALLLRFYFEKSYDEIADIVGKPRNTVGTLISRAKARLVRALE